MKFLLDTNVLSEARRREGNSGVKSWMAAVDSEALFLSVVTLGEIRRDVERLRPRDPDSAAVFETWLAALNAIYFNRILDIDRPIADGWGFLLSRCPNTPVEDALLAATALHHGMTLVSRNEKHLAPTGVPLLNPWS